MKNFKHFILTLTFGMGVTAFSQSAEEPTDYGSATVSTDYCMTLDADEAIQAYYRADATALNWASLQEAHKMCGYYSNNLVTLSPDFENGEMIIQIHIDRTRDPKDVSWWNQYLVDKCK